MLPVVTVTYAILVYIVTNVVNINVDVSISRLDEKNRFEVDLALLLVNTYNRAE